MHTSIKMAFVYHYAIRHVPKSVKNSYISKSCLNICKYSSSINTMDQDQLQLTSWETLNKTKKISKAMKAYLERATEHDEFMKKQHQEYNIGKRHLANMMGEDPENFTQKDVDRAIEYLFPSGIYDAKARPLMKPPEEVFPARKAAEFDEAGRPHHYLFYTGKSNFYKLLYDVAENILEAYNFEDKVIRKKATADANKSLELSSSVWVTHDHLENMIVENIGQSEYNTFIKAMERLISLPCSYRYKDFIDKYRKPLAAQRFALEIPKPSFDESGRAFITTHGCIRKDSRGVVTVRSPGTGKITINGKDITYFEDIQPREQVLFPLIFTGMQDSVDVECKVERGGPSGQSGAIRWGIAWSLRSFVDADMLQKMQVAGLLTRDHRRRERMKPGQPGARKKATWKKR